MDLNDRWSQTLQLLLFLFSGDVSLEASHCVIPLIWCTSCLIYFSVYFITAMYSWPNDLPRLLLLLFGLKPSFKAFGEKWWVLSVIGGQLAPFSWLLSWRRQIGWTCPFESSRSPTPQPDYLPGTEQMRSWVTLNIRRIWEEEKVIESQLIMFHDNMAAATPSRLWTKLN